MAENKYRVQDEDGIVQFETLRDAVKCIQSDPSKLGFIVHNNTGKVVTVWMRDPIGLGDVWYWNHSPEYRQEMVHELNEIELEAKVAVPGVPKEFTDEITKFIEGRGAEKIYEGLIYEIEDYIRDNVSYPFGKGDNELDEDETAQKMLEFAFAEFKRVYMSDRSES